MSGPAAVATFELSRAVERVVAQYGERRFSGPGNPLGTEFLRRGSLVAMKVSYSPNNPFMNAVHGLEDPLDLPAVLAFYAATKQRCWVDVAPHTPTGVTDALAQAGFAPVGYSSALYASPVPATEPLDADIAVIGAAQRDVFLDTLNTGFGSPSTALDALKRNQSFWIDVPEWRLLLAHVDGEPAAAAVLSIHGKHGYLASASTLPRFRNHGLQSALIAKRLELARALGCESASGQADAGSVSQCNQQRAGLSIVHTKSVWSNRA